MAGRSRQMSSRGLHSFVVPFGVEVILRGLSHIERVGVTSRGFTVGLGELRSY